MPVLRDSAHRDGTPVRSRQERVQREGGASPPFGSDAQETGKRKNPEREACGGKKVLILNFS